MNQLDVEYLPSRRDLESINMGWLSARIQKNGGFRKAAKDIGVSNKKQLYAGGRSHKSYPGKWNPEVAKNEIIRIKDELGIDHMPTRREILEYESNGALCSYISRSLGYYGYAKQLGLSIKESETTTGKACEYEIAAKLESVGYTVDQMPQNFPYDLLVNGCLKIDVKYGNLFCGPNGNFYKFSWDKKYPTCDIYVLVSAAKPGLEKTVRVIPSCHIENVSGLSVGEKNSIYDVYIDKWDYIQKYTEFYAEIRKPCNGAA